MNDPPSGPRQQVRSLTDLGNAERLVDTYGRTSRYVPPWKEWLIYDGVRWKRDASHEMERRAYQTARAIHLEIDESHSGGRDRQEAIAKHAIASESANRLAAMVNLAKALPGVAVQPAELDADPWVFNCANGVLDLRTGLLEQHRPELLLTKCSAVPYDPEATAPKWMNFLARIFEGSTTTISYVQYAVGYSLTGITSEQVLHFCHGTGSNGKSTFLSTISRMLGDDEQSGYAKNADFSSFIDFQQNGTTAREDLARLAGSRLVRSIEVGEGKRLNEALIKTLTGEDTISARYLYGRTFEFRPTFKVWLAVNHKPQIKGTDTAIWRRIRLIPFLVTIPPDDRDAQLSDKLIQELPGILRWAVDGCRGWQADGLKPDALISMESAKYREESDVLGYFLAECCEIGPGLTAPAGELYSAFKGWCIDNGERCITMTRFGLKLEERGFLVSRQAAGKRRSGLRLLASAVPQNGRQPWFSST